ncbi:MAG: hypothetical protein WCH85_08685 [Methanomicrobiales archaeon]
MFIAQSPQEEHNSAKLCRIREKIREVFGEETSMNDAMIAHRYTLSSNGDLIMILRGYR